MGEEDLEPMNMIHHGSFGYDHSVANPGRRGTGTAEYSGGNHTIRRKHT